MFTGNSHIEGRPEGLLTCCVNCSWLSELATVVGTRYAEAHQCDYDYKAAGRELLAKNNPLVQAAKVERL